MASDVATAGETGADVTQLTAGREAPGEQDSPAGGGRVTATPSAGMPAPAPAESAPAAGTAAEKAPTANAPTQHPAAQNAPAEDAPAGNAPAQSAPVQSAPAANASAQDAPAESASAANAPAEGAPAQSAPAANASAQDAPAQSASAENAPAEGAPAQSAAAQSAPAEGASAVGAPAQNPPIKTPPAAIPLADGTPVEDRPAEDTPADAAPADAPSGAATPTRSGRPARTRRPRAPRSATARSAARSEAARSEAVGGEAADPAPGAPAEPTWTEQSADPAAGAAVRRRLARLGTTRSGGINPVLEPLIKTVRLTHPKADIRPIERAYEYAARLHRGQDRKSGDPYITHPLAVTTILAELGMPTETLCAALLHDTIEDTSYTLEEMRRDFGDEIAGLVDGVTKLDKVKYGDAAQAETVRKMVVAMSRDIRVLVIKLADRLHNMRTLRYLPRPKQEQKSREVLEIFAPLAHRLGMNTVKWELEDLAFATLYPKRCDEIARLVSERAPRRDIFLAEVIEDVTTDLRDSKIKAKVTGRPKHYYSVYQKMIARNVGFDDIYDLMGIRVLVDSLRDCYAALGIIHARWNPVPGRFKDYIAMPKFNMYQSLHTTVIGPEGKPVELQIRTWGMHRRAEYGVAAHWKYKEQMASGGAADMAWLRQLVDWQRETADPAEFLDSLRFDLSTAEVYVFTPGRRGHRAAAGCHPGGLRLCHPHRGRPPDHRRPGQRPPGRAGERARQRRHRRDLHVEGGGLRAEP